MQKKVRLKMFSKEGGKRREKMKGMRDWGSGVEI